MTAQSERHEIMFDGTRWGWTVRRDGRWSAYLGVERQQGFAATHDEALRAAWSWVNSARMLYMAGFEAGHRELPKSQITPRQAAAVYRWAIGDGQREPPDNPDELRLVGEGLRVLIEIADGELERGEPIDV